MKTWLFGISVLSSCSSVLPLLAAFYVRRNLSTRRLKITAAFFVLCFVSEMSSLIIGNIYGNNMMIGNCFIFFELTFWCYFFYELLKEKLSHWVFYIVIFLMLIVWIQHLIFHSIKELNSLFSIIEASLIMFMSAFYLMTLSRKSTTPVQKVPEFWFAAGALLYFTSSFMSLGVIRYLLLINASSMLKAFLNYYMFLYAVVNVLSNIIYSRAFLCIIPSTKKI